LRAASKHLPLLVILVAAAALRLFGLDWDDGHHLHPDERFIAMVASKITLPESLAAYFDTAESPLNPYNNGFEGFAYGTLPLFLARWLGEVAGLSGYDRIVYLGRALSALADTGTVAFVYALASLLYGRRAALAAGSLAALSVLHIQLSHFFAFDTFATFFVAWSLYFAYRVWMKGGWTNIVLLGIGAAFAVACKISAITLAPIIVLACILPWPGRLRRGLPLASARLVAVGVAALLAYRVAEPYAFLGTNAFDFRPNPKFISDMLYWVRISSGDIDVPFMIQWAYTPKYTFVVESIVRWGLGPAAGLATIAGLLVAAYRLRRWGPHARHLLLIVWALLNLLYFGGQFAKFMRYLLPAYPALIVLAGYFVAACWDTSRVWWIRPGRAWRLGAVLAACVPVGVVLPTLLWALAFVHIYSEPNTRVAASRWLIDNLPSGAVLATEHWDDELPLALPGRERKSFYQVSMTLYDDEKPEKLRKLLDNLNSADYIVLASNRLSGSIPRLPQRYPLATEYYGALFDGRLGYQLVAEFTSRPQLLGIEITDDFAQEDFTVYDHPRVLVYGRGPEYSAEQAASVLESVSLAGVQRVKAAEAGTARPPLLTQDEWADAQAGGTWSAMFHPGDLANRLAAPLWWLVAVLLGLAAWPLLWRLTPHLADRGYGLARVLSLLLVAYPAWLLASLKLVAFGRASLSLMLIVLTLASAVAIRGRWTAFRGYVRVNWPAVVASEAAFSIGFLICLWMRLVNPDLWHPSYGGEKPMDFAYLNAVIKSDYFPPYDPWFAGGSINYYYFGFVLVAALVKLTTIVPATAYNLALALWFGLVFQTAFCVTYNLLASRRPGSRRAMRMAICGGTLSTVLVGLIGNLDSAVQVRDALWKAGGSGFQSGVPLLAGLVRTAVGLLALATGGGRADFDFWRSTRLIGPEEPGPIHEFPFFSFLYADLHAHLLALPLTLLAVGMSLELSRSSRLRLVLRPPLMKNIPPGGELARAAILLLLLAAVVGALRATNTWDFPTYFAVVLVGLACVFRPLDKTQLLNAFLAVAVCGGVVLLASSLLFAPFLDRYQLFYVGVEPVKARTPLWQFTLINGLFLFALASYLAVALRRRRQATERGFAERSGARLAPAYYGIALPLPLGWSIGFDRRLAAVASMLLALVLGAVGLGTLGLTLALASGLAGLAWLRWRSRETLFAIGLALLGLVVLSVPELVAIKGDVGRMNTVFKFYYQGWTLLAIVSAVWITRLVAGSSWPCTRRWREMWLAGIALLLAVGLLYPLMASPSKLSARFGPLPPTLDGMAFMQKAVYKDRDRDVSLSTDYTALRWMQDNIEGSPVVLEANTGLYKWGSRVSIYTGLPTVIGWDWHEKQQRVATASAVDERLKDVKTMFESPRLEQTLPLLQKYGVAYIYVGGLERIYYPANGLRKFEQAPRDILEPVYQSANVTIYRVQ
jgi:YYY domain-containing protein